MSLHVLVWSVVLGFVHIVAASHAASLQRGYRWTASVRDEPLPPLRRVAGRLELPLYAAGVPLVRSLVWNVAALGMLLFVIALLRA